MLKRVFLLLLILIVGFAFASCDGGDLEISMEIVEGSLPTSFSVDQEFPSTAQISVVSQSGTKIYTVTPDMVEGFDTSLSTYGQEKTMVIRRNDLNVEYKYKVDGNVNTRARFEVATESNEQSVIITLKIVGLTEEEGMYGIHFNVESNVTTAVPSKVESLVNGYKITSKKEGKVLALACYNEAGDNRLVEDTDLMRLTYTKSHSSDIMLTIGLSSGYIELSEGEGIKYLPALAIMI